ncbi:MAG: hypothetical protein FRX48_05252 [Lasallia pustulata]|uniref:Uncharacterized protein n=1 Tax=Lasallia pustulata TaxID=136370 RepID=A0A5M8PN28_9LECA|nr:MAG: hypothetical protein FRX48_05252 [Lasallia pustulata]
MRSTTLLLTLLTATTLATPSPPKKRQGNLSELLGLASYIGITALPTNPTALLQLGAAAAPLESALPTSPVLSVLETAAPKSFIGEILSNPSFASSFEAAFAAGSSPSWFNALPTDVKSYLHTYEGFPSLAAGAAALNSGLASVSAEATTGGGSTGGTSAGTTGGVWGECDVDDDDDGVDDE